MLLRLCKDNADESYIQGLVNDAIADVRNINRKDLVMRSRLGAKAESYSQNGISLRGG